MARPKRIDGVPTAKEAVEAEFWKLYEQKSLERITVKEVCEGAGVNKTTFYYHFQDIQEVLASIEEQCLPLEAPDMLADMLATSDKAKLVTEFLGNMGDRFERYCILLSSRGDPGFAKRAKETMALRWCEKLDIDYDTLPPDARLTIRFVMGGASSIFADHGDGEPFDAEAAAGIVQTIIIPLVERMALTLDLPIPMQDALGQSA